MTKRLIFLVLVVAVVGSLLTGFTYPQSLLPPQPCGFYHGCYPEPLPMPDPFPWPDPHPLPLPMPDPFPWPKPHPLPWPCPRCYPDPLLEY